MNPESMNWMNPESRHYRGAVITWFPRSPRFGFRVDVAYSTIGTYATLAAAKGAATRDHRAWRRTADAEFYAAVRSIGR